MCLKPWLRVVKTEVGQPISPKAETQQRNEWTNASSSVTTHYTTRKQLTEVAMAFAATPGTDFANTINIPTNVTRSNAPLLMKALLQAWEANSSHV
jgi:hypothetical protein